MGVAGAGKSTVGAALARALDWPFYDGDDFHPQANVDKMAAGIPLTDIDRRPWLDRLHELMAEKLSVGASLVLACSALKESYRQRLTADLPSVRFVYLKGDYAHLNARLANRGGHYMKPEMLNSQFAALEEPTNAIVVPVGQSVDEIVATLVRSVSSGY